MAIGVTVGKVGIGVLPDLSDFNRRLRQQLAEQKVPKLKVKVEPDWRGFNKGIRDRLRSTQDRLNRNPLKIRTDVDRDNLDDLLNGLDRARRDVDRSRRVPRSDNDRDQAPFPLGFDQLSNRQLIRNLFDETGILARARALRARIQRIIGDVRTRIRTRYDGSQLQRQLRRLRERLGAFARRFTIPLRVRTTILRNGLRRQVAAVRARFAPIVQRVTARFDRNRLQRITNILRVLRTRAAASLRMKWQITKASFRVVAGAFATLNRLRRAALVRLRFRTSGAGLARVSGVLAALGRPRLVSFVPRVAKSAAAAAAGQLAAIGGLGAIGKIGKRFTSFAGRIDEVALSLVKVVAVAGAAKIGLSVLGANIASVGRGVVQASGALIALPGLLLAGGAAAGILRHSLGQITDYLPKVANQWGDLENTISSNFWDAAIGPIERASGKVFPIVERQLANLSSLIGSSFGVLLNNLADLAAPALPGIFDGIGKAIKIFFENSKPFFAGIVDLFRFYGRELPKLSQMFTNTANIFGRFLSRVSDDGSLARFMYTGIEQGKLLIRTLFDIGRIFLGIGKAAEAAGAATLKSFSAATRSLADLVNSRQGQAGIRNYVRSAIAGMDEIKARGGEPFKRLIKSAFTLADTTLPIIGRIFGDLLGAFSNLLSSPEAGGGFVNYLKSAEKLVTQLRPGLEGLAPVLGGVLTIMGRILENIGTILEPVLERLPAAFEQVRRIIEPAIDVIGETVATLLTDLLDGFNSIDPGVFDGFGRDVGKFIQDLGGLFGQLVRLVPKLVPFFFEVVSLLLGVVPVLTKVINFVRTKVVPVVQAAFGKIVEFFRSDEVAAFGEKVLAIFKQVKDFVSQIDFGGIFESIKNSDVVQNLLNLFTGQGGLAETGGGFLSTFFEDLKRWFEPNGLLPSAFRLLSSLLSDLFVVLGPVAAAILDVLGLAWNWLTRIAASPIWGILGAILEKLTTFVGITLVIAATALRNVVTVLKGVFATMDLIKEVAIGIITGDWDRVTRAFDTWKTKISELWREWKRNLSNMLSSLGRLYKSLERGPGGAAFRWWNRIVQRIQNLIFSLLDKLPEGVQEFLGYGEAERENRKRDAQIQALIERGNRNRERNGGNTTVNYNFTQTGDTEQDIISADVKSTRLNGSRYNTAVTAY